MSALPTARCIKCNKPSLYLENTCQKHYNENKKKELRKDLKKTSQLYVAEIGKNRHRLYYITKIHPRGPTRLIQVWPAQSTDLYYWKPINFDDRRKGGYFKGSYFESVHRLGTYLGLDFTTPQVLTGY